MADFTEIIQEINTNLPDNNTQSITAEKIRTTLIDLTNTIEEVQNDFEEEVVDFTDFGSGQSLNNVSIVDDLVTGGSNDVLSAEQGKVLKETADLKVNAVYGTNLANPSKLKVGWVFTSLGNEYNNGSSKYAYYEDYMPIESGDTFIQPYTWTSTQNTGCFVLYNENKEIVKTITEGNSYTCTQQDISDGVAFIRVCMRKPNSPTDYTDFFFAKASTLPPYEPFTDYKPLADLEERVETLEESIGDIDEIKSDIQSLEEDKLDKVPYNFNSNNIINSEHLVNGAWLVGGNSPYYTTGHPENYIVCTDHIPVNGKNILVLSGVATNQYVFTFLVLNASGGVRRGIYGTSNVKYTYQEGDDSVMIAFNSNYFNSSYPAPFACYEDPAQPGVLLPYDEYKVESGDYKPLYDLEQRVETLESEIGGDTAEIDNISVPKLYMISNDIAPMGANTFWNPRDLSLSVWVDRLFDWNWTDNIPRNITWKENNSDRISFVAPFSAQGSPDSGVYNGGENIHVENYTKQLTTGFVDKNVSVQVSSVLNSATQNLHPKVLFIGDSVTFGSGSSTPASLTRNEDNTFKIHTYWEYIWKLFYDDRKKNGNSGFAYTSLGTVKGSTFTYDGSTHFVNAEGHGGWTTADYLNVKTISPFYDANKTWTGSYATELNAAGVKFSLAKYIERYRTLDNDGNRLTLGDGTGTEITSSNINNISVCTPTIVSIQLGFNDDIANSFDNIKLLVKAIKNEYQNMEVMVSLIDEAGTYYPEKYTEYDSQQVRLNTWTQAGSKLHHKMYTLVSKMASDDFLIPSNGIYFCPNYFIQPTAYSLTVRECPNAASISGFEKLPYNVEVGSGPHVHPSTIAHAAWGYQFAALIKHISYTNN